MASFKKTVFIECWGRGLQEQRFSQITVSKEVTSLILRINIHSSKSFVEPLLWQGIAWGQESRKSQRDSAVVNVTQPLSTFVSLCNSCLYQITLSILYLCIFSCLLITIHLLNSVSLWFSMPWPFCPKLYLMEIFKLLLQLPISWFSLCFQS